MNSNYTNFLYSPYGITGNFTNPKITAAGGTVKSLSSVLVQSPLAMIPAIIAMGHLSGVSPETYAQQSHAATIIAQQRLDYDWFIAAFNYPTAAISSLANYRYAQHSTSSVSTVYPTVRVRCINEAQNLSSKTDEANFSYLHTSFMDGKPSYTQWSNSGDYKSASISGLDRSSPTNLRAQWVPLSTDDFGPVSIGLLLSFHGLEMSQGLL